MALFTYKAIDTRGKSILGQIEAMNPVDLEMRLKRMGLGGYAGAAGPVRTRRLDRAGSGRRSPAVTRRRHRWPLTARTGSPRRGRRAVDAPVGDRLDRRPVEGDRRRAHRGGRQAVRGAVEVVGEQPGECRVDVAPAVGAPVVTAVGPLRSLRHSVPQRVSPPHSDVRQRLQRPSHAPVTAN
jgi:hypothetical protein